MTGNCHVRFGGRRLETQVKLCAGRRPHTHSLYKAFPYNPDDGREDMPADGHRVLRGGAFYYTRYDVRCACRSSYAPSGSHELIGFRPAICPSATAG